MSGRLVSVGAVAALVVALTGAVAACYDLPKPDCGFVCGPDNACPSSYTCADDHYCHRVGAPVERCAPADAFLSVEAAPVDAAPAI